MQGFNMGRYVPPDLEGTLNPNQASGKGHALGARASKPNLLTVRFELPFAIWCTSCPKPTIIGQGVRFNADKSKCGTYYSSPIFAFRFKHLACGGEIEIRTDPKNTAYVVHAGGRKRDTGDEAGGDSLVPTGDALRGLATAREKDEARATAFAALEKTIEDREAVVAATRRIEELEGVSERLWDDPYARNAALRKTFRVGRKQRERQAGLDGEVRERLGWDGGVELLAESEEDARRAKLIDFGTRPGDELDAREGKVLARPLFEERSTTDKTASSGGKMPRRLKSEIAAGKRKDLLASEIVSNTRMARDPFLEHKSKDAAKPAAHLPGLKRKRDPQREPSTPVEERPAEKVAAVLVEYDSD